MKFRLTIYTAFEAENAEIAQDIAKTIQSSLEVTDGVVVDEVVLDKDIRISLEEAINQTKDKIDPSAMEEAHKLLDPFIN